MIKITGLSKNAKQTFILPLETRETVTFKLYYMPTQSAWFFDFNYNDEDYTGQRLVLGMNILRMYKNALPFGLAVRAENHIEPFDVTDLTDRVELYVLNQDEVNTVETEIFGVE